MRLARCTAFQYPSRTWKCRRASAPRVARSRSKTVSPMRTRLWWSASRLRAQSSSARRTLRSSGTGARRRTCLANPAAIRGIRHARLAVRAVARLQDWLRGYPPYRPAATGAGPFAYPPASVGYTASSQLRGVYLVMPDATHLQSLISSASRDPLRALCEMPQSCCKNLQDGMRGIRDRCETLPATILLRLTATSAAYE